MVIGINPDLYTTMLAGLAQDRQQEDQGISDLRCRGNGLGYTYGEKTGPDIHQEVAWTILGAHSAKLARLGPKLLVHELTLQLKQVRQHVKSLFEG